MAWYSILPAELIQVESWAVRMFFLLGLITIGPWCALIIFDAALWLLRIILWELPWIGGRARGHQRPRAPSLHDRPGGQLRALGLRNGDLDSDQDQEQTDEAAADQDTPEDGDKRKENVAPSTDGRAHPNADGEMKRRAGRA